MSDKEQTNTEGNEHLKKIGEHLGDMIPILENTLEAHGKNLENNEKEKVVKVQIERTEDESELSRTLWEMLRGRPGHTPKKGEEYFTPEEIKSIEDNVRKELKEEVTPKKGDEYFTDEEKKDFTDEVYNRTMEQLPTEEAIVGSLKNDDEFVAKTKGEKGDDGDDLNPEEVATVLKSDQEFIQKVKGEKGETGKGEKGNDGSPDTGTQIVEKINGQSKKITLDKIEGSEGLKRKNELGYLRELADVEIIGEPTGVFVLTWSVTKKRWVAQASATIGVVPLSFDISSQFDGIATTFTIPAYSAILMFNITGWPPNGALRPTVDFTTPSNTTISLTSEVSAPQPGATGIILYVPA